MDLLKQQLAQQLISNNIKDKLKNNENIIFDESKCVIHRCIPFTDAFIRAVMPPVKSNGGKWETGDCLMYQVHLSVDDAFATLCLDNDDIPIEYSEKSSKLIAAFGAYKDNDVSIIKKWQFQNYPHNLAEFQAEIDNFISVTIPDFEKCFTDKLKDTHEGEKDTITSTRYERNPVARKMCLAYHGTACKVCGMDFGKTFGPEFEGKIEVHHIVPVSQIGKDYIVDPIKDLVPLCPNCHTAIHSKKDGTYTVEELKKVLNK